MYSVLLVASFRLVREAIRALLEGDSDFPVVGEAGDPRQTLRALDTLHPDLILFDLDPHAAEGIETIKQIIENHPNTKIIAMTGGGRLSGLDFLKMARALPRR